MRYLAQICSDYRCRCELAQNINNWWDWFVTMTTVLLFYWIVVAIHLDTHPIFFGWWIPIVAMWGGTCLNSRFYHHDLRGPMVSILWFIAVMALLPYLCVCHWDLVLRSDALGVGLRSLFTTVITEPFSGRPYDPHYINTAWWAHLPPCWLVASAMSGLIWSNRNEWRFLLEAPRWIPLDKNWCGYPLPNEWGFKPY